MISFKTKFLSNVISLSDVKIAFPLGSENAVYNKTSRKSNCLMTIIAASIFISESRAHHHNQRFTVMY
jgi:hypothetical protein